MTNCLITGANGFVGSHLVDYLIDNTDWHVFGMVRWRSNLRNLARHLDRIEKQDRLYLVNADLGDEISLRDVVAYARPDYVFHLAAQSYPKTSFSSPIETFDTNVLGTCRLLEVLRVQAHGARIHVCASSEVFGRVSRDELPIGEDCRFHPASPYAISKVGVDLLGRFYAEAYGMNVQMTRMFTHSVSRWTPVILRDVRSGLIDVKYISELREAGKRGGYFSGEFLPDGTQIWDFTRHDLEIWSHGSWTKVKHLSCHPIGDHKLLEITTRAGTINATDNHALIDYTGNEVDVGSLGKGERLLISSLPKVQITDMPTELAWLYGMFVAEGCLTKGKLRIDNKNRALLERCQRALLAYLACDTYFVVGKNDVWRLIVRKPERFVSYFEDCYAKDRNKRIPKIILNASKEVKLAFLRGYNAGDGRTNHPKLESEFLSFKTKSPILGMGLFVIAQEVLGVEVRIHIEHRQESRYFDIRPLAQTGSRRGCHLLKDAGEVVSILEIPYEGEVWDFETENHWFNGGIGCLVAHNTGPRRHDVFVESNFAKQIAMIEAGIIPPVVRHGNLDSLRTWADVRDAVRAYYLLLTYDPQPGAFYNIGGEFSCTVGEMLTTLLRKSTLFGIEQQLDPSRLRPIDADLQVPSTQKFKDHTGWRPEIPFAKTMQDLLDYWRVRVANNDAVLRR